MRPEIEFTNTTGLPEPLAKAIEMVSGDYSPGESDFTVTELTGPPRIRALRREAARAGEKIVTDVSDAMHSVMGSAIHFILERWARTDPDYLTEARYYSKFLGYNIGGQLDLYHPISGRVWDWKYTKSTTYRDGVKAEYVQQLNINAWLLRKNGHQPKKLYSAPIYRDFSKLTCDVKPPYVHSEEIEVAMWPDDAVERLLDERIHLHLEAEKTLPLCTDEDRWATRPVWATQSKTSGRAIKHGLCSTQEEAEQKRLAHKKPSTLEVAHRPGKSPRCAHYCPVANICSQWAQDVNNPKNQ